MVPDGTYPGGPSLRRSRFAVFTARLLFVGVVGTHHSEAHAPAPTLDSPSRPGSVWRRGVGIYLICIAAFRARTENLSACSPDCTAPVGFLSVRPTMRTG
jgi:hypothetical protein